MPRVASESVRKFFLLSSLYSPVMPAITAPHTTSNHLFFPPQPQATPASHQLHTSHMGIQTLVRVGSNESKEGARGGGRTGHNSRFSRQTHLNSPTITKNASKNKAIKANSPKMAAWFQKVHMGPTLHLNTSWISFFLSQESVYPKCSPYWPPATIASSNPNPLTGPYCLI